MVIYVIVGAVIGAVVGFLLVRRHEPGREEAPATAQEHQPQAAQEPPQQAEQQTPQQAADFVNISQPGEGIVGSRAQSRHRRLGIIVTTLFAAAIGAYVGYWFYDASGAGYSPSPFVTEIESEKQFDDIIGKESKPVLVDFYIEDCAPCRDMAPVVSQVADASAGNAVVLSVNADKLPKLAERYKVGAFPTLLIIRDGNEITRFLGVHAREEIIDVLLNQ